MAIPPSILAYLQRHAVSYSVIEHPRAFTAQEEASVARVPGHEWAKAVACIADEQPVMAVLPAPFLVDVERLRRAVGASNLRLARESEMKSFYPDSELGAMPPFGPLYGQRVLVDPHLAADPEIVFNGGSHSEAIRMRYSDFEALTHPTVADFAIPRQTH